MEKPYIISEELDLSDIYTSEMIDTKKIDAFRTSLDEDLRAAGKNTLWVASTAMRNQMNDTLRQTSLPVVSLDDRYVTGADQFVGISRSVDDSLNDVGYSPRATYQSINRQLDAVAGLASEVVVADDVVFSGEMICWLASELQKRNVKLGAVVCGIAIDEGIAKLQSNGITIEASNIFSNVEDELCERDFAIVPGSGRRIDGLNMNALYFDPMYGRPQQWASLPGPVVNEFFVNSLQRSLDVLQPGMPMEPIGAFYGYGTNGPASDQIKSRLKALS